MVSSVVKQTKFNAKHFRQPSHFPTTEAEFSHQFGTEAQCEAWLDRERWPNGFVCPDCGDSGFWIEARQRYKCHNNHWTSLTSGTVMSGTRTPLTTWFYAVWLLCTHKPGVSALQMAAGKTKSPGMMGIWGTLHKLRGEMVVPGREKLNGYVEVDEIYVGGVEHRRGRGAESKALVLVATEVIPWRDEKGKEYLKAGRCRMRVIQNATGATLMGFLVDNIARGSVVSTDSYAGYNRTWMHGFAHETVLASEEDAPLPTLGRVVTNLKRWLEGTHKWAVRKRHLQAYLNEYCFRFNRRSSPWRAFQQLLGLTAHRDIRVTYHGLWKGTYRHPNPAPEGYYDDPQLTLELEPDEDPRPVMARMRARENVITSAQLLLPSVEPLEIGDFEEDSADLLHE